MRSLALKHGLNICMAYLKTWHRCESSLFLIFYNLQDVEMSSPDLEFRLKNRIFDLDRLKDVESNKF